MADGTAGGAHRVYVVELADSVGPRRRPDRPNLYVGTTQRTIETVMQRKPPKLVKDHGLALRPDLCVNYRPTTAEDVKRQRRKLKEKLARKGYTVNGDCRVWRLYVIELDQTVRPGVLEGQWVYVGESSKSPEERFLEHISAARNKRGRLFSPIVLKYGRRLRPDLYASEPVAYTSNDSKNAEARLAERLRSLGFEVAGGH